MGPGEPELITLKALKALQGADIIYCPGTQTKSRSRDILQALPVNMERVRLFHVPMSKDRTFANQAYDALCTEIASLVATGKNVAITAEGDSGFYSSVNYMFDKLASMNLPVTTVAGVPAFIVGRSHLGPSHCETRRKTRRPTGNNHRRRTGHLLSNGHVVVIMKLSQCTEEIHRFMQKSPCQRYHYYENVGTSDELHTTAYNDITRKDFPYFSLMIIRPCKQLA
ncbi:MAG: precorrin-2 C(20)-methyltransferase [Butyricimonas faecihominis]